MAKIYEGIFEYEPTESLRGKAYVSVSGNGICEVEDVAGAKMRKMIF